MKTFQLPSVEREGNRYFIYKNVHLRGGGSHHCNVQGVLQQCNVQGGVQGEQGAEQFVQGVKEVVQNVMCRVVNKVNKVNKVYKV